MGQWKHRLLSRDLEGMAGVCQHCGLVDLYFRPAKGSYVCAKGRAEQRGNDSSSRNARRIFALSDLDVAALLSEQGGGCAICLAPLTPADAKVDHCHDQMIVRGVLCHACNVGLGFFRDDPIKLQAAINYVLAA